MTSPGAPARAPGSLRFAAVVVAIEGVATVAYAAAELFHLTSSRAVMGATTSLFFALYGAALVLAAWGVWTLRTWSRGPVLLTQLIWLGLAWNFRHGETRWLSMVLTVVSVATLVAMLLPASVQALNRED